MMGTGKGFRSMRGLRFLAVPLLVAGMGVLQAQEPRPSDGDPLLPGDPIAGRRVFVSKGCHECHSVWGAEGRLGPDLADLAGGRTLPQIAGLLWSHTPGMIQVMEERGIPRPTFKPREMADMLAYIHYLDYFDEPGDPEQGRRTFKEKGCKTCHDVGAGAREDHAPLNRFAGCYSPMALARDMWNAAPGMRKAMEGKEVRQPLLTGRDLADILAYLNTVARPEPGRPIELLRPGDPRIGAQVFESRGCNTCHGHASTDSRVGPDLQEATWRFSATQIAGLMWNHSFTMLDAMEEAGTSFSPMEENELSDLIAYLYFVPYPDRSGEPSLGLGVFRSKGCNSCHGDDGMEWGEAVLGRSPSHRSSPVTILTAFWNHAPRMEVQMRSAGISWPRFEGDEMRDLLAYLAATIPAAPASRTSGKEQR